MGRHALGRGGRHALVSTLAVVLAAGSITLFSGTRDEGAAQAATIAAAGTAELVLDDPRTETRRTEQLLAAGRTGFLHRQSGVAGVLWTDYDDGDTVTVEGSSGVYKPTTTSCYDIDMRCATGVFGQAADTVALPHLTYGDPVSLWSPGGGALRTVDLSQSADRVGTYGETSVTVEYDGVVDGQELDGYVLHLVDLVDGEQRDRVVTGYPADGTWEWNNARTGDDKGALFAYPDRDADGRFTTYSVGYLDFAAARFTPVFTGLTRDTVPEVVLTGDRVGWYTRSAGLHLKPRADLAATETVPLAGEESDVSPKPVPVLVGNWAVLTGAPGVQAVSLTDGTRKTLLSASYGTPLATPDGGALVTGGTTAADWWVQRVALGADGTPQLTKLVKIPPYENPKTGLALSRGSLRVAEDNPQSTSDSTSVRTLTSNGGTELSASAATESASVSPKCPYAGATCSALWGVHDGTKPVDVYLGTFYDADEGGSGLENADRLVSIGGHTLEFGTAGGSVVDVSDDWAVYNSGGSTPAQYVGEFGQGQILKRSVRAAALNGSVLWSSDTAGRLTSYSLTEKKTLATVTVPSLACVPSELQAAGRWVYWACGTASAGVYDTKAGTSVAVTPGDVLLGDGFTVRHDHEADRLVLTDATTGATRVIASDLPDTGLAVDRRFRWTVDEYTGLVAWFDRFEQTHVATTGVAPSAPTAFRTEAGSYVQPGGSTAWTGAWLLSRPVDSWSLTFTSVQSGPKGRATRTVTGGAVTAQLSAGWDGKSANGDRFPNGDFTWTLKVTGLGTATPVTVASGEGFLQRGNPVRHDFASVDGPDGRGDLLTLNSAGGLTYQHGTGTGKFGQKTTGTGWPTSARFVPFGDLSGDRCNDVLVRLSSGALRLYKPGCNAALKPSTSYTTLGNSGWNQYDVLTSPGDVSGDGRADLVARNSATGTVYLYKATSTGKLSARVKLYDGWKGYKKIVGVGDITGDGIGDLLAQDGSNTLYRFNGKGDGTFAARTKLFTNWGGSYNAIVGVGDITDDGRADLVSRDSGGTVYRNSGDGKGSFGARVKIASGWGSYKTLS
ncbi:FG-GAP repeat domain-containing protein [Streptomyces gilvus]|uniref:FG-GAP repeat domain-containing protein n=1 Tax=Streptomyces gilvus TaxID=2920937 RepID=UPI001F0F1392|nr:VCBS repeat-containing protein [Streptomyces sp. CME 23]MCH5672510.1 VCBS repeat-containing protein [Streptomyces sp. CME 23]